MLLIFLGFVVLIIGLNVGRYSERLGHWRGGLLALGTGLLLLGVAFGTVVQVGWGR